MLITELNEIKNRVNKELGTRDHTRQQKLATGYYKRHVLICGGTGCTSGKSKIIFEEFEKEFKKLDKDYYAKAIMTGCFGLCAKGPIVIVYPEGTFYCHVKPEDVQEIVLSHLVNGNPVERLIYRDEDGTLAKSLYETKFYGKQHRLALVNCGVIDPENIEEYIALNGYQALAKCLQELDGQKIVDIIKDAGLRGRGGGGFPTGLKWQLTKNAQNDVKFVCCNADEGDPGAFMDRSILEGDPHKVIEAMEIAGYAIGAKKGYIYVRAEYPIAVHRINVAIEQAKQAGLLGKNILGTNFEFDLEIRLGAGAFVCGEETALMTSIEGKRGCPRPRPPFPANKGLFGKPTLLNNVETYANIAPIILNGADWFKQLGTEKSKGTKVFALGGKITNTGLVEVPMGTTLREIVEDIGGGIPHGKKFKAAQTGGHSG
ncbi:MAG: NAD(P)H-dependent oxidoreductase subunit E, partial [Clostridia bacterium]